MSVCSEALACGNTVIVEHTQRPESHVLRVVIVAKRKRVISVQPPEIGVAAVLGFSKREHALILPRRPGPALWTRRVYAAYARSVGRVLRQRRPGPVLWTRHAGGSAKQEPPIGGQAPRGTPRPRVHRPPRTPR